MRPPAHAWALVLALVGCPPPQKPVGEPEGGVKMCARSMCGAPPEIPKYECADGSPGGPSGRCVADDMDVCDWEMLMCTDGASECVVAGCEDNLCVEAGTDVLDECEYGDLLDCDIRGICERQDDGECGFTSTDEVERCKKYGD